jgi:hypothetical protein
MGLIWLELGWQNCAFHALPSVMDIFESWLAHFLYANSRTASH